jgi:EAL domain-containing protein (putative c-di-GMP-specific phosphodiesterase class I)
MAWNVNLSLSNMSDSNILKFLQSQLDDYPNSKRISFKITAQNALVESAKFSQFRSERVRFAGITFITYVRNKGIRFII